jgi:hypothetical protein
VSGREKCLHCNGTGYVTPGVGKVGTYCTGEIALRHEKFGCMRWEGHAGYHEGYVGVPACPECGGWEAHVKGCSLIGSDLDAAGSLPDFDVRWNDGDDEPTFHERGLPPASPVSREGEQ